MSREEILARFEQWLDGALAAEEPPRGVEAEILTAIAGDSEGRARPAPTDAYSLWAAMTALTQEVNTREIPWEGQAFDPRRMNAIDRQESSAVPEGTVIEVYRSGYEWNGEVFRPAQVKVSCAPAGKKDE